MAKRNFAPKSTSQDKGLIGPSIETDFGKGMIRDISSLEIPDGSVAYLDNCYPDNGAIKGIEGTSQIANLDITTQISGYIRTRASYNDIKNSKYYFAVETTGNAGYIDVYYISNDLTGSMAKATIRGGAASVFNPIAGNCNFTENEGDVYLMTVSGLYRISDDNNVMWYKINHYLDTNFGKITYTPSKSSTAVIHRYLTTQTMLEGVSQGLDRRNADSGVRIAYETSPATQSTGDSPDYTEVIHDYPNGLYNIRQCDSVDNVYASPEGWRKLNTITGKFGVCSYDDTATIGFCEISKDITYDFRTAETLEDVLSELNRGIKEVIGDEFFIGIQKIDGSNPAFFIGSYSRNRIPNCPVIDLDVLFSTIIKFKTTTSTLNSTGGPILAGLRQGASSLSWNQSFTHYSLYRTLDVSKVIKDINIIDGSDYRFGVNPEVFAWVADVPRIKFFANNTKVYDKSSTSLYMRSDDLVPSDIGNKIVVCPGLQGAGDIFTITGMDRISLDPVDDTIKDYYIITGTLGDVTQIKTNTSGTDTAGTYYTVAFWRGEVLLADVKSVTIASGGVVTSASAFSSLPSTGELVAISDGSFAQVVSYTDGSNFTISVPDASKYVGTYYMALLDNPGDLQPSSDYWIRYTDSVTDEEVSARIGIWNPKRFYRPLPPCNLGVFAGGMFFCSQQGEQKLYYCHAFSRADIGFHLPGVQEIQSIKEPIRAMTICGGNIIIRTDSKTYGLNPTTAFNSGDDRFGEILYTVQDPQLIDDTIGVWGMCNIDAINSNAEVVFTNEPAVRFFDGSTMKYSPDMSYGYVLDSDIKKLKQPVIVSYDSVTGITIWGEQ